MQDLVLIMYIYLHRSYYYEQHKVLSLLPVHKDAEQRGEDSLMIFHSLRFKAELPV